MNTWNFDGRSQRKKLALGGLGYDGKLDISQAGPNGINMAEDPEPPRADMPRRLTWRTLVWPWGSATVSRPIQGCPRSSMKSQVPQAHRPVAVCSLSLQPVAINCSR